MHWEFVLNEQFICSNELPDRWWKIKVGTGPGLPHSGDVADSALFFAWLGTSGLQGQT